MADVSPPSISDHRSIKYHDLGEFIEVEITLSPHLSAGQEMLVDLHSVINLISVLSSCLELLEDEGISSLGQMQKKVRELLASISKSTESGANLQMDPDWAEKMSVEFEAVVQASPALNPDARELVETVRTVLKIFEVRLSEFLGRVNSPEKWVTFSTVELTSSIEQVLAAIEQNAHGKYRIVRNIAEQSPRDYQVDLQITSHEGDTLRMPPILQDVLRDLIANARKYTLPGGKISAGIHSGPDGLRLVVEDNGKGIPELEIPRVVEFGYRASNTQSKPTMGGGFGLTKARWVTDKFGGRMWIRSAIDKGTRITIWLPAKED